MCECHKLVCEKHFTYLRKTPPFEEPSIGVFVGTCELCGRTIKDDHYVWVPTELFNEMDAAAKDILADAMTPFVLEVADYLERVADRLASGEPATFAIGSLRHQAVTVRRLWDKKLKGMRAHREDPQSEDKSDQGERCSCDGKPIVGNYPNTAIGCCAYCGGTGWIRKPGQGLSSI